MLRSAVVFLGFLGAAAPQDSRPAANSPVVARVGSEEIRADEAFREVLFHFRGDGLEVLKKLAGDAILRAEAKKNSIVPDPKDIDDGVAAGMKALTDRVAAEYGDAYGAERFLRDELLTTPQEYEAELRAFVAKSVLAGLVIRYDALRTERVIVRHIALGDEKTAKEWLAKLQAGADFAGVARQESIAPSKAEGGKLPPFDREFDHPIAKVAFELPEGSIAGPIVDSRGPRPIYHLVRVLERIPPKREPFAAVADAIRKGLRDRPIERFEFEAFMRKMEKAYPVEILGQRARIGVAAPRPSGPESKPLR
jgi:peptidyl-prolyl cis-trans isomerase C